MIVLYKFAGNSVALITIMFSVIYGLPHLIMVYYNGDLYNPVPVENAGSSSLDEYPYAINLREAIDGHLLVRNAQLIEHKDSVSIMDFFPYAFWGIFAMVFNLNAFHILILLDFLFPALSFLALFLFVHKVLNLDKPLSILVSVLILVFNSFVHLATVILTLDLKYFDFTKSIDVFSTISRYPSPEFTFIILLGGLAALYCTFKKDDAKYPLAAAVAGTALTYSYLIYSSFFWMTVAVFSLTMMLTNIKNLRKTAVRAASIIVPAALLCVPYVLNYLSLSKTPAYADLLSRLILLKGRIIYSQLAHVAFSLALIAILYLLIFKRDKPKFYFLSSIMLAAIIISNVQIVLGYTIQPDHWIIRVMDPMYFVLFALILHEGRGKGASRRVLDLLLHRKTLYAITVAVLLWVLAFNISFALNAHGRYSFSAEEADIYSWLNANAPAGSAVLTLSVKQNSQLSYATHNTVYLPNGLINVVSNNEIVDRVLSAYNVFGVPESELLAKLNVSNDALRLIYIDGLYSGKIFSNYDFERYYFMHYFFHANFFYGNRAYLQQNPDIPGAVGYYFPSAFREHVIGKYRNGNYTTYRYDYILVGPYERGIADVAGIEGAYKMVYTNSDFALYAPVKGFVIL